MKIVFAGTPEFAKEPLKKIVEQGYVVAAVITQEDKPQGRKGILTPSPVKTLALSYGLPVFQPKKIRDEILALKKLGGDILITCAYGQILTQEVLDCFPKGVWNIHAGLLPAYRGASPMQSCILNGEEITGVCVMKTELGLDTGDILLCKKTPIGETETYGELSERLSVLGAEALGEALPLLKSGEFSLTPQGENGARTYKKIKGEAGKIDFSRSAKQIVDLVRAFNPEPIAYTFLNGVRVNVLRAERVRLPEGAEHAANGEILTDKPKAGLVVKCGEEAVKILELQPAGGKKMTGGDFINGRKCEKGQVFVC